MTRLASSLHTSLFNVHKCVFIHCYLLFSYEVHVHSWNIPYSLTVRTGFHCCLCSERHTFLAQVKRKYFPLPVTECVCCENRCLCNRTRLLSKEGKWLLVHETEQVSCQRKIYFHLPKFFIRKWHDWSLLFIPFSSTFTCVCSFSCYHLFSHEVHVHGWNIPFSLTVRTFFWLLVMFRASHVSCPRKYFSRSRNWMCLLRKSLLM